MDGIVLGVTFYPRDRKWSLGNVRECVCVLFVSQFRWSLAKTVKTSGEVAVPLAALRRRRDMDG